MEVTIYKQYKSDDGKAEKSEEFNSLNTYRKGSVDIIKAVVSHVVDRIIKSAKIMKTLPK